MTPGLLRRTGRLVRDNLAAALLVIGLGVGLFIISLHRYLLFHALVEMFSIVIALMVFSLTWNVRHNLKNGYLLFLGISYLFVAGLDLLHTLAYPGMGVFPGTDPATPDGPNLGTQLWLAARYMQSLAMVAAPFHVRRFPRPWVIVLAFGAATTMLLLSIFTWENFPVAFAGGLTPFKRISEYVITLFFLAGAGLLLSTRRIFPSRVFALLLASAAANVLAELAFTDYGGVYDLVVIGGHYFKVVSFIFIYKAIVEVGLREPQELLYRELALSEQALRETSARARAGCPARSGYGCRPGGGVDCPRSGRPLRDRQPGCQRHPAHAGGRQSLQDGPGRPGAHPFRRFSRRAGAGPRGAAPAGGRAQRETRA